MESRLIIPQYIFTDTKYSTVKAGTIGEQQLKRAQSGKSSKQAKQASYLYAL